MTDTTEPIVETVVPKSNKFNPAKKIATQLALQIVLGVVAHYATKTAIDTIDNYKSSKTNVPQQ